MIDNIKNAIKSNVGIIVSEFLAVVIFITSACSLAVMTGKPYLIAYAFGVSALLPVVVFARNQAAHLNSGVTIGMVTGGETPPVIGLVFLLIQTPASMVGILLASLITTGEFDRQFASKFISWPAEGMKIWNVAMIEGSLLFVLTLAVLMTGKGKKEWIDWLAIGVLLSALLGLLIFLAIPRTGGAINPSRALAPWLLAMPESDWDILIRGYLVPGVVGPVLAGLAHRTYKGLSS